MGDIDFIKKIENQIQIPLKEINLNDLKKKDNSILRAYSLNKSSNVNGLKLNYTDFADIDLIGKLSKLEVLVLYSNFIENYSPILNLGNSPGKLH